MTCRAKGRLTSAPPEKQTPVDAGATDVETRRSRALFPTTSIGDASVKAMVSQPVDSEATDDHLSFQRIAMLQGRGTMRHARL